MKVNDKCRGSYASCVSFKNSSSVSYGFEKDSEITKVKSGHYNIEYKLISSSPDLLCRNSSRMRINLFCPRTRIGVRMRRK